MSELTLLGDQTTPRENNYLRLKQNKDIIQLIKFIINPALELDTTVNSYINIWTDENGKAIGTCYTAKNGTLLYVKDFVATPQQLFPELTDRHLKLSIHLLSQDEQTVTFSVSRFNADCGLKKYSQTAKRHYNLLEDLLKYQIAYGNNGEQIKDANKKNYNENKNEITFKPVILLKSVTYNMTEKTSNNEGLMITHTEVTTKLSRAKLELCDIFTSQNRGLMFYHKDLLKLKQNSRIKLAAVSIAFNIYYLQSVNSKKKQENKVVYNISTILGWIGVYEGKYLNFFEKGQKRGVSFFVEKLNTYFKELENLDIYAKFINMEKDVNKFYNKTQVEFNISDLKNHFN